MDSTRTLAATLLVLGSVLPASALADETPPPVGDFAFVDSGRTLFETRFGASFGIADLWDQGATHAEAVMGYLGADWNFGIAKIGDASGIVLVLGLNVEGGAVLSRTGMDLGLGDFAFDVDASAGAGWRQDFGIETYLMAWIGYRFALQGLALYLTDDLTQRLWHLAYVHAGFRHEFLAFEGGAGFGAGGGHFHAGARLWMFDDVWVGAELSGWITPGERDLWIAHAFFALRQGD